MCHCVPPVVSSPIPAPHTTGSSLYLHLRQSSASQSFSRSLSWPPLAPPSCLSLTHSRFTTVFHNRVALTSRTRLSRFLLTHGVEQTRNAIRLSKTLRVLQDLVRMSTEHRKRAAPDCRQCFCPLLKSLGLVLPIASRLHHPLNQSWRSRIMATHPSREESFAQWMWWMSYKGP